MQQQQQEQEQEQLRQRIQQVGGMIPPWIKTIFRWILIYWVFSIVSRFALPYLLPGLSTTTTMTTTTTEGKQYPTVLEPPPGKGWPTRCAFRPGDKYDLFVYLSYNNNEVWDETKSQLIWKQSQLSYDWSETNTRDVNLTIPVDDRLLRNETATVHLFLIKTGMKNKGIMKRSTSQHYFKYDLTKYMPKKKDKGLHKLISTTTTADSTADDTIPSTTTITTTATDNNDTTKIKEDDNITITEEPWLMYWRPSIEIRILGDAQQTPPSAMPEMIRSKFTVDFDLEVYWPVVYVNEFWAKHESLIIVNETLKELPLTIHYSPISLMKLTLYVQTEASLRAQASLTGGMVEEEMDELRRIIIETNPYFLGLTMIVSMVHSVFDFLAFKNDISFWRSRKSVAGLSVKTLMLNCVMQIIIFLYLLDNETSWLILISAGVGLVIELWKIGKATKVKVIWRNGWIPWVSLTDRESYTKSKTKVYDDTAMRYLSYGLYPMIIGYAIYSLLYETHKSWYSWVLGSLTGTVYTFGFIAMTPQLFINYKLKSVAHLPWRALIYKALNTVIDDLFSFIIKMPTMHRIACFRDDVVFLIYLYQRWIYPVDKNRQESVQWEDAANDFIEQKENSTTSEATTTTTTTTTSALIETSKQQ